MGIIQRLLGAIRRHPGVSWAALGVYAAAVTFPHQNVQYVVNLIALRFSHKRLYQGSAAIALFEVALLSFLVVRRLAGQAERRTLGAYWILTIGLIFGTWRVFTANNVELVHYPQYFPEGFVLAALTLSAAESLAWVAMLEAWTSVFNTGT